MRLSVRTDFSKLLKLWNVPQILKEYRPRAFELAGLCLIIAGVYVLIGPGFALLVAGVALVAAGYTLSD